MAPATIVFPGSDHPTIKRPKLIYVKSDMAEAEPILTLLLDSGYAFEAEALTDYEWKYRRAKGSLYPFDALPAFEFEEDGQAEVITGTVAIGTYIDDTFRLRTYTAPSPLARARHDMVRAHAHFFLKSSSDPTEFLVSLEKSLSTTFAFKPIYAPPLPRNSHKKGSTLTSAACAAAFAVGVARKRLGVENLASYPRCAELWNAVYVDERRIRLRETAAAAS